MVLSYSVYETLLSEYSSVYVCVCVCVRIYVLILFVKTLFLQDKRICQYFLISKVKFTMIYIKSEYTFHFFSHRHIYVQIVC